MGKVRAFCRWISAVNDWAGRLVCVLIIAIVLITTLEVTLRYVFNKPTLWAWDVNVQLMAVMVSIGAGYTLLHKGHVIVDIVVGHFSPRVRAIIDLVTSGLFFLGIGMLLWRAVLQAASSVALREVRTTIFSPPLYPLRVIIAVGILLFLLQGIVKFIRDLTIAVSGKEETL